MAKPAPPSVQVDRQIERWPIERLILRASNPRKRRREHVANIAASMRGVGMDQTYYIGIVREKAALRRIAAK